MKLEYELPIMNIVIISEQDVVRTSGPMSPSDGDANGETGWGTLG